MRAGYPNPLAALLCLVSGHNPAEAHEHGDLQWYAATGVVMIATASLSALSAYELLHDAMGAGTGFAVIGSVFAFVFVYCVDLFINMTPRLDDSLRHRLVFLLVRGPLGLVIAAFIGLGTALHLNRDDINAYVAQQAASHSAADVSAFTSQAPQTKQINMDNNHIGTLTSQNSQMEATAAGKKADWWQDMVPCHAGGSLTCEGDTPGWGPKSRVLYADYQDYLTNTLQPTEKANNAEIASLRADIQQAQASLNASQKRLAAADQADTGLAARTRALLHIMSSNWVLWILPIVILAWDQTVMLTKVLFPRRRTEIAAQEKREDESRVRAETLENAALLRAERASNPAWAAARTHAHEYAAAAWLAEEKARQGKRTRAAEYAAAEAADPAAKTRTRARPGVRPRFRLRMKWSTAAAALVVAVALLFPIGSAGTTSGAPTCPTLCAAGGQSIDLHDGEKLSIPFGAITGNAPVTAIYTASHSWAGNSPASDEVTFSTKGTIVGKPVLSLPVTARQAAAVNGGALHVAYWSSSSRSWTSYPAAYDPKTRTMNAVLTHFSTWRFWTWDWASDLASISQTAGQWEGRRAADAPDCGNGPAAPGWYQTSTGLASSPGLPVLGCVMGHPGDDVLDVELVNNRPYGLMVNYGGATVKWGQHSTPSTLVDGLRDAVGDFAARTSGGLYLPPLSHASIGIVNTGRARSQIFTIVPTRATILADTLDMTLGPLIRKGASAAAVKWGREVFAAAAGSCAQFLTGFPIASIPDASTVMSLLTSAAPECIKEILTVAAGGELALEAGLDAGTGTVISAAVNGLEKIITIGKWADIEDKLGKVLDFSIYRTAVATRELGYGFAVLAS